MMSLACAHSPSIFGWPSAVRGGANFGSSFGGFRGSIQLGGGAAFGGGGGPCCAATAPPSNNAVNIPKNSFAIVRPPTGPPEGGHYRSILRFGSVRL